MNSGLSSQFGPIITTLEIPSAYFTVICEDQDFCGQYAGKHNMKSELDAVKVAKILHW